jgi:hypothetical protein
VFAGRQRQRRQQQLLESGTPAVKSKPCRHEAAAAAGARQGREQRQHQRQQGRGRW